MEFDHVGIAVKNIEEYFQSLLHSVLGMNELSEIVIDPIQNCKIAFATSSNGVRLELIEPLNEESPVNQILQKKKGGIYHMCFVTNNFDEDVKHCLANKFIALSKPQPAIAFDNRRVIFFSTPTFEIIELVEEIL
jgi:methylmalonyl-CoA/ethylmalonyl-CoA epimerase